MLRYQIKVKPCTLFLTRDHSLGTKYISKTISISQLIKDLVQLFFAHRSYILKAPAAEYFIRMMVMVMIVTAATFLAMFVVVVMMMASTAAF